MIKDVKYSVILHKHNIHSHIMRFRNPNTMTICSNRSMQCTKFGTRNIVMKVIGMIDTFHFYKYHLIIRLQDKINLSPTNSPILMYKLPPKSNIFLFDNLLCMISTIFFRHSIQLFLLNIVIVVFY